MAVIFTNGFETGDFTGWTDQSGTPPDIATTYKYKGVYGARADIEGASWTRYNYSTTATVSVVRSYIRIDQVETGTTSYGIINVNNPSQTKDANIRMAVDGSSNATLKGTIYDGSSTFTSAVSGTVPQDTWLRVECKLDLSGAAAKLTWGWAEGDGALTTVDTDYTGGNAWGVDSAQYFLFGDASFGYNIVWHDDIAIANTGGDYPLGPTAAEGASILFPHRVM